MKKFILSIFIAIILASVGYSQVALSIKDSLTSLLDTDIMLWQRKVTGTFLNRQMSWNNLKLTVKDYLDGQNITWAGIQTFNGATFASGSHGKVLFNGDSVVCTTQMFTHGIQRTQTSSIIGRNTAPFFNVYAKTFTIVNSAETDSGMISIDADGNVAITNLAITEKLEMDSAAALQALKLEPESYTISDVNDTVITTSTLMSNMRLILPGDVLRGIETINMEGAASGHILIIYTTDADDSVLVEEDSDGNLNLDAAGDFYLRSGDNIAFMYIYDQPSLAFKWIELWRKNN